MATLSVSTVPGSGGPPLSIIGVAHSAQGPREGPPGIGVGGETQTHDLPIQDIGTSHRSPHTPGGLSVQGRELAVGLEPTTC